MAFPKMTQKQIKIKYFEMLYFYAGGIILWLEDH